MNQAIHHQKAVNGRRGRHITLPDALAFPQFDHAKHNLAQVVPHAKRIFNELRTLFDARSIPALLRHLICAVDRFSQPPKRLALQHGHGAFIDTQQCVLLVCNHHLSDSNRDADTS